MTQPSTNVSKTGAAPPLDGVRMLDFGRYIACPYAGMLLADMGAEVIRVEPPGGGDDRALGPFAPNGESIPYSMITCRNKKDITLDIRKPEGQELLGLLVKTVDVVLHNFAPGAPEAATLSYANLSAANPRVIVIAASGFGKTGPYADRPGFDSVAQGVSSMMSWSGFPGSPPTRAALAVIDESTGIMMAYSALLCLMARQKTGLGQEADIGLLDTAMSYVATMGVPAEVKLLNHERPQIGNHSYYNFSDSFQCKDGRWVMISAIGNRLFKRFAAALGIGELVQDPRFQTDLLRFQNRAVLQPIVAGIAAKYASPEFVSVLEKARVPCGPVNSPREMVNDPQVKARELLLDVDHPGVGKVPLPGIVPKLSHTPGAMRKRASKLGENNEETYLKLPGITRARLQILEEAGVI